MNISHFHDVTPVLPVRNVPNAIRFYTVKLAFSYVSRMIRRCPITRASNGTASA
jgi:hypothetical protein